MKFRYVVIALLLFLAWGGIRAYSTITFDREVEGYLKRAADSNTVELAAQNLETALAGAEARGLTAGYTSVIYNTPDEDVEFWYTNLSQSLAEIRQLSPDATPLERSNLLMKLRETIMDNTDSGTSVTAPEGISVYPNNGLLLVLGFISTIGLVVAFIGFTATMP
jgi:hypothetical protein